MFNFNSFRDSFVHNPNFTFSKVRETLLIFKLVQTRFISQKIQPRISLPKKKLLKNRETLFTFKQHSAKHFDEIFFTEN